MASAWLLLVVNSSARTLLIVEGPTNRILTELALPPDLTIAGIYPAGDKAYLPAVANGGQGELLVVNLAAMTLYRLPVSIPHPAAFAVAGNTAVLAAPSGALFRLGLATLEVQPWGEPLTQASCVGIALSNETVYTVWENSGGGILATFDLAGQLTGDYALPGIPAAVSLNHEGLAIIPVAARGDRLLIMIRDEKKTGKAPEVVALDCPLCEAPVYSCPLGLTIDNNVAYITAEDGSLVALDLSTFTVAGYVTLKRAVESIYLIPGAKQAIATCPITAELAQIDLTAGTICAVTDMPCKLGPAAVISR